MSLIRTASLIAIFAMTTTGAFADDVGVVPDTMRQIQTSRELAVSKLRRVIYDGPTDLAGQVPMALNDGIPLQAPPAPALNRNAPPLYAKWSDSYARSQAALPTYAESLVARFSYSTEQLNKVRDVLTTNAATMQELHAAIQKDVCVPPPADTTLYANVREAARQIRTETYLLVSDGRYSDAITNQMLGVRIARQLETKRCLQAYLTAASLDRIAQSGMRDILSRAASQSGVAEEVRSAIAARQPEIPMPAAIKGDAGDMFAWFETVRHYSRRDFVSTLFKRYGTIPLTWSTGNLSRDEVSFYGDFVSAAEAEQLSRIRQLHAASLLPSPNRRTAMLAVDTEIDTPNLDEKPDIKQLWAAIFNYGFSGDDIDSADRDRVADQEITEAAAYALAAKARTGDFPASLPTAYYDPWSLASLQYRKEASGFVVFSVGRTGRYDGGSPWKQPDPRQLAYRYPVVPVPRPGGYD